MEPHDAILQLLKEMRDNQVEDIALRKRVMDESLRLQRLGLARQRFAVLLISGGLLLLGLGVAVLLLVAPLLRLIVSK